MLVLKRTRTSALVSRSALDARLHPDCLVGDEEAQDDGEGGQLQQTKLPHRRFPAARQGQHVDDQKRKDQAMQIDELQEELGEVKVPQ